MAPRRWVREQPMIDALDQPPPPASPEVQIPAEALRISEERLTLVARATTDTVWDWKCAHQRPVVVVGAFAKCWVCRITTAFHADALLYACTPRTASCVVSSLQATVQGSGDTWRCNTASAS